jgi:diguanylate cyclase (GGDEF)-like protein/PAS domain S-box-containing protein
VTDELDGFFDLLPEPFCIAGTNAGLKRVNAAFEQAFGWKAEELSNQSFFELVHPDDLEATRREIEKLAAGSRMVSTESRTRCVDGSEKWFRWRAFPSPDDGFFYAFGQDITELKRAREGFRLAIESSPSAMILVDSSGKIVMLNRVAENVFRYDHGQLVGQPLGVLVPDHLRKLHDHYRKGFFELPTPRPMGSRRDLKGRRRDGSEIPVEIGLHPVETGEGTLVIAAIIDLTARKQQEERIWKLARRLEEANAGLAALATTDSLTGLYNRRAFEDQLERDLRVVYRTRTPLSVLLLDVDRFKEYNDRYGHPAGDGVLRIVGELLSRNARGGDFVARYGGEEFAVILPNTDGRGARVLAERFRGVLEGYAWPERQVTASFGASTLTEGRDELDSGDKLIAEADRALYYSKRSGRNQVTHVDSLEDSPGSGESVDATEP